MTLQEFILKWNGKPCEIAGSPQNQCVDLANAYLRDVLNHPIVEWTDAVNFPSKLTDFEWILNSLTNVPQEGDLVVWKTNHISIFLEGDANLFTSFDENWPTGSFCTPVEHNYNNVLGWLHPKPQTDPLAECLAMHDMLVKEADEKNITIKNLNSQIADRDQQLTTKDLEISNLKTQLLGETQAKETALTQAKECLSLQDKFNQLKKDYDTDKINWNAEAIRNKQRITTLQNQLAKRIPTGFIDRLIFIFKSEQEVKA